MDKPDNVISLINLATVRSLELQWGYDIDPLRFRANLYIDGARPWEEFDWIGSDIRIGDAVFRVDRRNGRCGATNVNPDTGRRDLDMPSSLRAAFGHKELGIYLTVTKAGRWRSATRCTRPPPPPPSIARPRRRGGCRRASRNSFAAGAISSTSRRPACRINRSRAAPRSRRSRRPGDAPTAAPRKPRSARTASRSCRQPEFEQDRWNLPPASGPA